MLRSLIQRAPRRLYASMAPNTPMEDAIRTKVTEALKPSTLEIYNDSHLHSHHKAMVESQNTSAETHFRVVITSSAFEKKFQPARHRMVYNLLKEEMAKEGGIHALQLRTRTPEEEAKMEADEAVERARGKRVAKVEVEH